MAHYSIYVSFYVPLAPDQLDWAIDELYRDPKTDDYELNDPGIGVETKLSTVSRWQPKATPESLSHG